MADWIQVVLAVLALIFTFLDKQDVKSVISAILKIIKSWFNRDDD